MSAFTLTSPRPGFSYPAACSASLLRCETGTSNVTCQNQNSVSPPHFLPHACTLVTGASAVSKPWGSSSIPLFLSQLTSRSPARSDRLPSLYIPHLGRLSRFCSVPQVFIIWPLTGLCPHPTTIDLFVLSLSLFSPFNTQNILLKIKLFKKPISCVQLHRA